MSVLGIVGWVDFELRNILRKIANIAFRCRKFPIYNIIIDGIVQQTNQYVGKLLLIVYLSVFCVCQHTVDNYLYTCKHSSRPIHNIQGRMEKINRNLSVHFNSKLFTGIKHEAILSELENEINLEDIKSIQMTGKSCIVTLKSEQAKYKILNSEISLKNRSVNSFEIDKNVTNVTIEDAHAK